MIKYLATASLLLAGAYLTGSPALAADQGVTDTEILIGEVEPLTGPPAILGVAHTLGVKIAIAEVNAAGGLNGRKIKYAVEDDGYVHVPIPNDLYVQIEQWRNELCQVYGLVDIDMDTFIAFLLTRSVIDVSILLWHLPEGLDAFKDFRKLNDN